MATKTKIRLILLNKYLRSRTDLPLPPGIDAYQGKGYLKSHWHDLDPDELVFCLGDALPSEKHKWLVHINTALLPAGYVAEIVSHTQTATYKGFGYKTWIRCKMHDAR